MQRYKSIFTYNANMGEMIWAAVQAWLVEGDDGSVILVDTGSPLDAVKAAAPFEAEEISTLPELLSFHGCSIGDIDTVIMTHLHYDHAGYLPLFKKARVYVQEKELEAAYNPHPIQKRSYNADLLSGLNFICCKGEDEIKPGITVFPVPGHSAGTQAVEISTKVGKVVISGLCTIVENFFPLNGEEVITPGIHLNAMEVYESMLKIKRRADFIIPMHDLEYAEKDIYPQISNNIKETSNDKNLGDSKK
jgi:glyoxylase-like metal-dependent hydrolase (beta-lactamase superfamily II)